MRQLLWIFVWLMGAMSAQAQSELIPNPHFVLSPDEAKFERLLSKAMQKTQWMQLTNKEFQEQSYQAYQISRSELFWQVKGWQVPPGTLDTYYFFSPDSAGTAYLQLENNAPPMPEREEFAETVLLEALEAGQKYEVKIRFRWHIPQENIPQAFEPSSFVLAIEKSPQSAKYRSLGKWEPNLEAIRQDKHRIKVVRSFQENHGGYYPADFAQDPEYIEWYEESVIYRAKGGEEKIRLAFGPKPKEGSPLEVFVSWVSVKALPRPSSLPGAGQADPGKGY